jgi:hypothetical protein
MLILDDLDVLFDDALVLLSILRVMPTTVTLSVTIVASDLQCARDIDRFLAWSETKADVLAWTPDASHVLTRGPVTIRHVPSDDMFSDIVEYTRQMVRTGSVMIFTGRMCGPQALLDMVMESDDIDHERVFLIDDSKAPPPTLWDVLIVTTAGEASLSRPGMTAAHVIDTGFQVTCAEAQRRLGRAGFPSGGLCLRMGPTSGESHESSFLQNIDLTRVVCTASLYAPHVVASLRDLEAWTPAIAGCLTQRLVDQSDRVTVFGLLVVQGLLTPQGAAMVARCRPTERHHILLIGVLIKSRHRLVNPLEDIVEFVTRSAAWDLSAPWMATYREARDHLGMEESLPPTPHRSRLTTLVEDVFTDLVAYHADGRDYICPSMGRVIRLDTKAGPDVMVPVTLSDDHVLAYATVTPPPEEWPLVTFHRETPGIAHIGRYCLHERAAFSAAGVSVTCIGKHSLRIVCERRSLPKAQVMVDDWLRGLARRITNAPYELKGPGHTRLVVGSGGSISDILMPNERVSFVVSKKPVSIPTPHRVTYTRSSSSLVVTTRTRQEMMEAIQRQDVTPIPIRTVVYDDDSRQCHVWCRMTLQCTWATARSTGVVILHVSEEDAERILSMTTLPSSLYIEDRGYPVDGIPFPTSPLQSIMMGGVPEEWDETTVLDALAVAADTGTAYLCRRELPCRALRDQFPLPSGRVVMDVTSQWHRRTYSIDLPTRDLCFDLAARTTEIIPRLVNDQRTRVAIVITPVMTGNVNVIHAVAGSASQHVVELEPIPASRPETRVRLHAVFAEMDRLVDALTPTIVYDPILCRLAAVTRTRQVYIIHPAHSPMLMVYGDRTKRDTVVGDLRHRASTRDEADNGTTTSECHICFDAPADYTLTSCRWESPPPQLEHPL